MPSVFNQTAPSLAMQSGGLSIGQGPRCDDIQNDELSDDALESMLLSMPDLTEIVFGPDTRVLVKGKGKDLAGQLAAVKGKDKPLFFPLETANGEDVYVAADQVLYIKSDKP